MTPSFRLLVALLALSLATLAAGGAPAQEKSAPAPEAPPSGSPAAEPAPAAEQAEEEDAGWPIPSGPPARPTFEADPAAPPEKPPSPISSVEVQRAVLRGELGHRAVREVRRLGPGARPEFRRQGGLWAYDRSSDSGLRAVYTSDGRADTCLTCERYELRKSHVLAPTWHPGGQYLVALVQGAGRLDLDERRLASPARALHSELWALTADGKQAWQLTRSGERGRAVYDAVFSAEGDRIAWTERLESAPKPWGAWVVRVARFELRRGVPILEDVQSYEPSPWGRFVGVEAFRADDRGLWVAVEDPDGQTVIGSYSFAERRFERLPEPPDTPRPVELLRELPGTEWLVEASSRGLPLFGPKSAQLARRGRLAPSDLWLATASGRARERLTYFNEPNTRNALGNARIADFAVATTGDRLLLQVLDDGRPDQPGPTREALYLLELDSRSLANRGGPTP